jgi:5-formyltetrahydrofolate cyclo-ligase
MASGSKRELRARLLATRAALTPDQIAAARAAVREHVLSRFRAARRVAAYQPLRTEPGSVELLEALVAGGAAVLVPILLPDRDLDWASWPSGSPLGVAAIAAVDLALVPALAVSRGGVRLGRAGGSYDRALTRVRPGVPIVALVYDDEILCDVPADPWDVPVTAAITPTGWHELA